MTERQLRVSAATLAYGHNDEETHTTPRQDCMKVTGRTRVASPFTVESDSPYQVIDARESRTVIRKELTSRPSSRQPGLPFPNPEEENPVTKRITDSLETAGIGQPGNGQVQGGKPRSHLR